MYNTLTDALADAQANATNNAAKLAFAQALVTAVRGLTVGTIAEATVDNLSADLSDALFDDAGPGNVHVLYFNNDKGKWFYVQKDVARTQVADVLLAQLSAGRTVKVKPAH